MLPGAVIFGMGLVTFVAPLTATVMAAADPDHVSVASGVNNAIARAASLAALAVVPVISGLTSAHGPAAVTHSFLRAFPAPPQSTVDIDPNFALVSKF